MGRSEANMRKRLSEKEMRDKMSTGALYLIYNKELKIYGRAYGIFDGEEVRVFEGNPDGSDDKTYTIEEFIEKYVILENESQEYEEELE